MFRDPFIEDKTKNAAGLGIGLRISYALLKKLTNEELYIELISEKGNGTTVIFEIM